MRNIIGRLKQLCVERAWNARKELGEIHTDSTNLQPVLLSTRSKSNFTMESVYIRCYGLIPDSIVMALIRIFYLKVLLTCPRLFHQFRYVIYHSYFLLELSTTTQILVKKHFAKIILLFFAITNQTYISSQNKLYLLLPIAFHIILILHFAVIILCNK